MKAFTAIIFFCFIQAASIFAFPGGAPSAACKTLLPQHGMNTPSTDPNPYKFDVSQTPIIPGGRSYLLTISGISPSTTFVGFIVQARNANDIEEYTTFGSFEPFGAETDSQGTTCLSEGDTATHTSRDEKGQVIVKWNAPPTGSGSVKFVGTVVKSYTTIFANQASDSLTYGQ